MYAGDKTEKWLKSFGVTKERWIEAKKLFGMRPACNCGNRQDKMNEWDKKVRAWWKQKKADPNDEAGPDEENKTSD